MARRVELTGNTNRRIVLKDTVTRRVSPSDVGDKLGAEALGAAPATRGARRPSLASGSIPKSTRTTRLS
jgi:hypothetical protein